MLEVGKVLPWDWVMGVNDITFFFGRIENPNWTPGSKLPRYYSGDIKEGFSFREIDSPMLNFFEFETFVLPTGYQFSVRTDIPVTGSDSYNLPFKAADIVAVSRYIKTDILTAPTDSTFTIATSQTQAIQGYDNRFLTNNIYLPQNQGKFLCRITNISTNEKHFRSFTVSSGILTLKDFTTGAISGITGLSRNWPFELLGAYTMLPEATQIPNSVYQGFIVKNVALGTGEASIKFATYDKPVNPKEKLAVVYYDVSSARPQFFDPVSIDQHGIYVKSEKPDFILETSQLTGLQNNSRKYYQPQRKFKLRTRRPNKLREGDIVPFNLSRFPKGNYEVSSVRVITQHEMGEIDGQTFDEVEYEFTNYDYDLDTVLASLKRKNDVLKAKVTQSISRSYTVNLNIPVTYQRGQFTGVLPTPPPNAPSGLYFEWVDNNGFNLFWNEPSDPDIFHRVTVYINPEKTIKANGYNNRPQGNGELVNGPDITNNNIFYIDVFSIKNGVLSLVPASLTVEKKIEKIVFTRIISSKTQIMMCDVDGKNLINLSGGTLTANGGYNDDNARISRDGQYIVFNREISGSQCNIMRMDKDGSNKITLTSNSSNYDFFPDISENNQNITFSRSWSGGLHVFVKNLSTSTELQLEGGYSSLLSKYNIDGTKVIYQDNVSGYEVQIRSVNVDSTSDNLILGSVKYGHPAYNADNSKITFILQPIYGLSVNNIYTSNIDGSGVTQITSGSYNDGLPNFSFSGDKIIFQSNRFSSNNINIVNVDTTNLIDFSEIINAENEISTDTIDTSPMWGLI